MSLFPAKRQESKVHSNLAQSIVLHVYTRFVICQQIIQCMNNHDDDVDDYDAMYGKKQKRKYLKLHKWSNPNNMPVLVNFVIIVN